MNKKYHVHVSIEKGLDMIRRGENIFTGTPLEAFHDLMDAREKGHIYYTGCDSVNSDGSCAGHETK